MNYTALEQLIDVAGSLGFAVTISFKQSQSFTLVSNDECHDCELASERFDLNSFVVGLVVSVLKFVAEAHPEIIQCSESENERNDAEDGYMCVTLPSGKKLRIPLPEDIDDAKQDLKALATMFSKDSIGSAVKDDAT